MIDEYFTYANDPSELLWASLLLHMRILDLYSDVMHHNDTSPAATVKEALQLDYAFSELFRNAPSTWSYEVGTSAEFNQFPSCCPYVHIYQTALSAQSRNAMRNGRIMLHWIIKKTLKLHFNHTHDFSTMAQLAHMSAVSVQLQIDTLATVQQHLGVRSLKKDATPGFTSPTEQGTSQTQWIREAVIPNIGQHKLPVLRTTGGTTLLWHLALIVNKGSPALRPAARTMIQAIGDILSIQQAFALLEALEEDDLES